MNRSITILSSVDASPSEAKLGRVCLKVATFINEKNEDNIFLQFTSYLIVIKKTTQLSV